MKDTAVAIRSLALKINGIDLSSPALGKDEECAVLDTLHAALQGTGNYLEPLFSAKAVEDYKRDIRNDVMVDPHGDALALGHQAEELRRYNRELQTTISGLMAERDAAKAEAEGNEAAFNVAMGARDRHISALATEVGKLHQELAQLRELKRVFARMVELVTQQQQ